MAYHALLLTRLAVAVTQAERLVTCAAKLAVQGLRRPGTTASIVHGRAILNAPSQGAAGRSPAREGGIDEK